MVDPSGIHLGVGNYFKTLAFAPWKAAKGEKVKAWAAAIGIGLLSGFLVPLGTAFVAGCRHLHGRIKHQHESKPSVQESSRKIYEAAKEVKFDSMEEHEVQVFLHKEPRIGKEAKEVTFDAMEEHEVQVFRHMEPRKQTSSDRPLQKEELLEKIHQNRGRLKNPERYKEYLGEEPIAMAAVKEWPEAIQWVPKDNFQMYKRVAVAALFNLSGKSARMVCRHFPAELKIDTDIQKMLATRFVRPSDLMTSQVIFRIREKLKQGQMLTSEEKAELILRIKVQTSNGRIEDLPLLKGLLNDKSFVMAAIEKGNLSLEYVSEALRRDSEVVFVAVKNNAYNLKHAIGEPRNNKEIVLEAVRKRGDMLYYASANMQGDEAVAMAAVKNWPQAILWVSKDDLQMFTRVARIALYLVSGKVARNVYSHFPEEVKMDPQIKALLKTRGVYES